MRWQTTILDRVKSWKIYPSFRQTPHRHRSLMGPDRTRPTDLVLYPVSDLLCTQKFRISVGENEILPIMTSSSLLRVVFSSYGGETVQDIVTCTLTPTFPEVLCSVDLRALIASSNSDLGKKVFLPENFQTSWPNRPARAAQQSV